MSDERPATGADEAREDGRVVVAAVTHPFRPGLGAFQQIDEGATTRRVWVIDNLRCRVCGRPEGPPHDE